MVRLVIAAKSVFNAFSAFLNRPPEETFTFIDFFTSSNIWKFHIIQFENEAAFFSNQRPVGLLATFL